MLSEAPLRALPPSMDVDRVFQSRKSISRYQTDIHTSCKHVRVRVGCTPAPDCLAGLTSVEKIDLSLNETPETYSGHPLSQIY